MDKPSNVTATPAQLLYEHQHITDDSRANIVLAQAVCLVLAAIAVCMRFVSRRVGGIQYKLDDWFIIGGLIFTASVFFCTMLAVAWGVGRHAFLAPHPVAMKKAIISAEVLYNCAMFFIKTSVLLFYYRVFFVSQNLTRMLWAVGIFVFVYSSTLAGAVVLQCLPLSHIWDTTNKGHCLAVPLAATILAVFNVVTDIMILAMPMPVLWNLRLDNKKKMQIMGVFCLGGFVLFCSIWRTVIIHLENLIDPAWDDVPMGIWTLAELGIGIVSACLPTMLPLYARIKSIFRSSSRGSRQPEVKNLDNKELTQVASLSLRKAPSNPALSKTFAHLGVLGDLETGTDTQFSQTTIHNAHEGDEHWSGRR